MMVMDMKKAYIFKLYFKVDWIELGDGLGGGGVSERKEQEYFPHLLLELLSEWCCHLLRWRILGKEQVSEAYYKRVTWLSSYKSKYK